MVPESDHRLEAILELIGNMAALDFSKSVSIDDSDHPLNAIAQGLMWLNEELEHNVVEKAELKRANKRLEQFAYIAAHDLKSPLNNISGLAKLLTEQENTNPDQKRILEMIIASTNKLKGLIEGLLEYSSSEKVAREEKIVINPNLIVEDLKTLFPIDEDTCHINLIAAVDRIEVNKKALDHIIVNLVSNAVKYNDKEVVEIDIGVAEENDHYQFFVKDNGTGISQEFQKNMFEIFEVGPSKDKFGNRGNGIGLAIVKKMVETQGGAISVDSQIGYGTKMTFTLKKDMISTVRKT